MTDKQIAEKTKPDYREVARELAEALRDMRSGWRYIQDTHGNLYGVGWERSENAASAALAKYNAIEEGK